MKDQFDSLLKQAKLKVKKKGNVYWNPNTPELYEEAIRNKEANLTKDMAIRVLTGEYTGRSPDDRYIVEESSVKQDINWGDVNQPISEGVFNHLYEKVQTYLGEKKLYVKDMYAGADEQYRLKVRIISEAAYHGLFAHNMFIEPSDSEKKTFAPDLTVLAAPHFQATPGKDGIDSETFIFINFSKKIILVGGTLYSGEIKKSVFTVLNYLLPKQNVMSMHCSANMSTDGTTAIFFGLSGTGKTTLSSEPDRILIGDDEHGWSEKGIFNIEGGCYAKTINLSRESEPLIYEATKKPGTILENVVLDDNRQPNFKDKSFTENTRCAYPIKHIPNADQSGNGAHPKNIIFLTCDAYGVLPPLSKLTLKQSMYHFISGYTAKVAGTERGVTEPKATFSPCFGAPFMPLHPNVYAELLAKKIHKYNTSVWLLNTGWTGGAYGAGKRIALTHTRKMLSELLQGNLDEVEFRTDPVFGLAVPKYISGVPKNLLFPRDTWSNKQKYDRTANRLSTLFRENFEEYRGELNKDLTKAGPIK
ncbi:phosphoenolpyruvate carboxykinase (ATP) [Aliifodinibius sp. S!AR15-10]|uniref:phosphoenolpyruvate carboxykinase (ATP) n=1 Tax=Aliifodinibius sp. S!AR15-10 TaxID=2950437 RepID=UPI00285851BB|nr:phosphoenolpyruvate carboxykinase (ATP) [Aliifodinibius sp. S!AR15-10]MDR8394665.1 phosphoenolpyruvate carboxykinase (ATP) [Aliifodinibius sp. S!AR15-10]